MTAGSLDAQLGKIRAAVARFKSSAGSTGVAGGLRVTILDDSASNGRGLDRIFDALGATLDDIPVALTATIPSVRAAHRAVFTTEGSAGRGSWAPLAPRTLAERARLGFGPGPIQQRTGALMAHVLSAEAKISRTADGFELRIAPDREVAGVPKYRALAKGTDRIPARPMVTVGSAAAVTITSTLQRALRARALANGLG